MADLLDDSMIRAGFGLLVLALLTTIAFYIVSRFRDYNAEDREAADALLANLREMHLQGDITDEEFRTIKLANHPHQVGEATEADSASPDDGSNDH